MSQLIDELLFPSGTNAAQIRAVQTGLYGGMSDFRFIAVIALVLTAMRWIFCRVVARPLGEAMGLKHSLRPAPLPNAVLEAKFARSGKRMPPTSVLEDLAKASGQPTRKVERWWRQQLAFTQPSRLTKFCEAMWRFVYYIAAVVGGLYVLHDKSWLYDRTMCWVPCAVWDVPDDVVWMYWIQLGFYMSLLITQFFDIRRKDFWEMFVHHVATIGLMTYSYYTGHMRVGTLVLIVHDVSDIFLEAAKSCHYVGFARTTDALFAVFAVVFFVARLFFYPAFVLYTAVVDANALCGGFWAGHVLFVVMLGTLQALHIFWFRTIARMVYLALVAGSVANDDRSEEEAETVSEDESPVGNGQAARKGDNAPTKTYAQKKKK